MTSKPKIIRSHRKTLALQVTEGGELVVRAPFLLPELAIKHFIKQKATWIQKKQEHALQKKEEVPVKKYVEGDTFQFLGEKYLLKRPTTVKNNIDLHDFLLIKSTLSDPAKKLEVWYKKEARRYFSDRLDYYTDLSGIKFKKLRLSGAAKRWGSCSSKKTISLNWRLIMAPEEIIDYVIIHELVHIKHMNHSKKFWIGVEKLCPEYKKFRKWLRDNGHKLSL